MRRSRVFVATAAAALVAIQAAAQGVPRLDSYEGVAVRILQSNNAGNVHHLIDPATRQVAGLIRGCPHAHNLAVHPDGLYYYCSNEQDKTVDVFDTRTLQQIQQIPLSERPNKIVVNKKHRKIYAGSRARCRASGVAVIDVIDVDTNKLVRSIPVPSGCTTPTSRRTNVGCRRSLAGPVSRASRRFR